MCTMNDTASPQVHAKPCRSPVLGAFDPPGAKAALTRLLAAGIELKQLSLVCRLGQRAACGELWGRLARCVFMLAPAGLVSVAGPLAPAIAAALDAAPGAGQPAFRAALIALGLPPDEAARHEAELQAGRVLIIHHGAAHERCTARHALGATGDAGSLRCGQAA